MTDIEHIKAIVNAFDEGRKALTKFAFTPAASPAPPMTAMPPGDPNAMPPGAPMPPPPGDPNAMPPPPPGDPNAMPPPPPGDPNAMPPGAPMPPPGDPNAAPPGAIPPELESALSQLAGGMDAVSQTVEEQQAQTDQLSQRMLAMEEEINSLRASLKGPAPFEGEADATPTDAAPMPTDAGPTAM